MEMCAKAHKNQVDKAGMPYVMHPIRVAANFIDPRLVIIALLHDILEDSKTITAKDISNEFNENVLDIIKLLTRVRNENYFDYIKKIKAHSDAVKIKLADLKDNINILRLVSITDEDKVRLNKYIKAYRILSQ